MIRWRILLIVVFVIPEFSFSQSEEMRITGKVIDHATKEPLPFVNIFFASTSIGSSSLADGSFLIKKFPPGKYDLIASYIGYKPYSLSVDFSNRFNGLTKEIKIVIELEQELKVLKNVTIKEDTLDWAINYEKFKKHFLGETQNSKLCKILNPHDIHIYFDAAENLLVAHAKKPIVVENRALGYNIYYHLYKFEINFRTGVIQNFGIPQYEELRTEKERVHKIWQRARAKAYRGSVTHFMNALRDSALIKNNFTIKKIFIVPNPKRLSDDLINSKVDELNQTHSNSHHLLKYYARLKSLPKEIDSLGGIIYSGKEFTRSSSNKIENIKGKYQVAFDDQEETEYLPIAGRRYTRHQESVFQFFDDSLKIYENGYYEDVRTLYLEGYLSWHEKIPNWLPQDFEPVKEGNQ
jgi:hypothetical protein